MHGVAGAVRLGLLRAIHHVASLGSSDSVSGPSSDFDSTWNVQTDGIVDLSDVHLIDNTNYILGSQYVPTSPEGFTEMVQCLTVPFEDFIFVDCGAGKGRVLLMASELPFRRIIGIEFVIELARIAEANISSYSSAGQKCKNLEMICLDATKYQWPNEPTVLFLYHPFERPVMEVFVGNIERSLEAHPRPFFVLYRNPRHGEVWNRSAYFRKMTASPSFAVFSGGTSVPLRGGAVLAANTPAGTA
jgi:hypothetical protein